MSINTNPQCLVDVTNLAKFDKVTFEKEFVTELKSKGIPYPYDWHLFLGIDSDNQYQFMGSMGGRFTVSPSRKVVTRVTKLTQ